jgi:hypothetical protein
MAVLRESLDAPAEAASCQLGFGKQQSVLHRCDDNCTVRAFSADTAVRSAEQDGVRLNGILLLASGIARA